MAKQKTEVNKSEEIRQVLNANPKAKAKEVVATLDEKGIKVNTAQVYFVMGTLKGRKKKARDCFITPVSVQILANSCHFGSYETTSKKVVAEVATITAPPSSNGDALKTILKVKEWAAEVGGMKKLIALAEALSE